MMTFGYSPAARCTMARPRVVPCIGSERFAARRPTTFRPCPAPAGNRISSFVPPNRTRPLTRHAPLPPRMRQPYDARLIAATERRTPPDRKVPNATRRSKRVRFDPRDFERLVSQDMLSNKAFVHGSDQGPGMPGAR
jgi:hypothetical protein